MKKVVLFSFFLIVTILGNAQNERVGDWIDYLPYHNVFAVAANSEVAYGATVTGLIEYSVADNSVVRFSKVMGLSDVGISCLAYNDAAETFVVGYSNGKIDLITPEGVVTISDLNKKAISGNKSLNNIYMDSVYAYIATGFGIVKFNVAKQEFTETYYIEPNGDLIFVNDLTISNDSLYAVTVNGIRKAYLYDPQITFYEAWSTDTTAPVLNGNYNIISSLNDTVYLNLPIDTAADLLYRKAPGKTWVLAPDLDEESNNSVEPYTDGLLIAHKGRVSTYNSNWEEISRIYNYGDGVFVSSNAAIKSSDNTIWIGDRTLGMIQNPRPFWFEIINPKSPAKAFVDEIDIINNKMVIAAGLKQNNWTNSFSNDGVFIRSADYDWSQVTKFTDTIMSKLFDIITVQINPFNTNEIYGGSIGGVTDGGGLVEIIDGKATQVFNTENSTLKKSIGADWVSVTGLDYDAQGNLWVANSTNPQAISVFTNEKKWIGYSFGQFLSEDRTGDIMVDKNGYKWVILPHGGKGVLIFNDNNTLEDLTDDQSKILNNASGQGGLPSADVYSIAEDQDGEIWVGTSEGVGIFYSPTSIFAEDVNYDAQQIIVEVNGYFQYLLGTETVTAIAVDGANRKWLGTKGSGVFLMSADGITELYHFTAENSPLLSNFIRTIKINESTGEVLFGTDNGIIAFKGTATGEETKLNETYAYPNPVPENYYGPIAIKGLPTNAEVRITDIAGNLVFDTKAEGTQAIWNGNDMNGQRVGVGIYLVIGIDMDGNESKVAKIMFTK